jgi:hypothetical protein
MIRRSSFIAFEILVGILVTLGFGVLIVSWRLSQGPIQLPILQAHIEAQLSAARGGRPVTIEGVQLAWSGADKGLELKARNVAILDAKGAVQSRSQAVDIGLALHRLALGRVSVARAAFEGADITITLLPNGGAEIAFGPPGSAADILVPAPPPGETLDQRVGRVLDSLAAALRPIGPGGDLKAVRVRDVHFIIVDKVDDTTWRATGAKIDLVREKKSLTLAVEAEFTGPRGPAPAQLTIATDTAFQAARFTLSTRGVRPTALAPSRALGPFASLTSPITATVAVALDRARGVTSIEGDAKIGRGEWEAMGGKLALSGGRVKGKYDLASDKLLITDIAVEGARTKIKGAITVRQASALLGVDAAETAPFDVALSSLEVDAPGMFSAPVALRDVAIKGVMEPKAPAIVFEKASFGLESAKFDLNGRLTWGDDGKGVVRPGVQLKGGMSGAVDVRTVLTAWPLKRAVAAREWVDQGVKAGKITTAAIEIGFSPKDLADGFLANDKLSVAFAYEGAEVAYLQDMTQIQEGRGNAVLQGNRFDLTLTSGKVGNLIVTQGKVELPRFNPKGALASFSGRVDGQTQEMVGLLLQAPLELAQRLPVIPATITGRGTADFTIRRPMLREVTSEQLRFAVDGRFENVGGQARDGRFTIADWRLRVTGDERALTFAGPLKLGQSAGDLSWTESFRVAGPGSRYTVSGRFDAADIESLGIPILEYAQGPILVDARVTGRGMDIASAAVRLDLKEATMGLPFDMWTKPAGRAAGASFEARETGDGGLNLTRLDVRGAGFAMSGEATIDRARQLSSAAINRFWIEGRTDLAARASRGGDGGLIINAEGAQFDIQPFLKGDETGEPTQARKAEALRPFRASVRADRALMKGGAELLNARLEIATLGPAIVKLSLNGASPGGKRLALALGGQGVGDVTPLSFKSDDAGFAFRALTGADNVRGGAAEGAGTWRPGAPGRAEVTLKAKNFQVVRVPAMARLFSAVGSLRGAVEMLNGEGISFTGLEAPMTFDAGKLWIAESRAAGPSLGITAKGAITLNDGALDLDGVLVPSYGLNSFVSGVPVLGQLLASRPGEGVIGMTYSINGPPEAARVGVNPLSALTPGILRRIFEPWAAPAKPPAVGEVEKKAG